MKLSVFRFRSVVDTLIPWAEVYPGVCPGPCGPPMPSPLGAKFHIFIQLFFLILKIERPKGKRAGDALHIAYPPLPPSPTVSDVQSAYLQSTSYNIFVVTLFVAT